MTPTTLFHRQVAVLRAHLAGVLDGRADDIHDARIATRRLRELLPLVSARNGRPAIDDLTTRFKRIGRSLGRLRDADARVALLSSLEARVPHAAPSLIVVRQQHERRRTTLMRKLVKRLERLEVQSLLLALEDAAAPRRFSLRHAGGQDAWQRALRRTVVTRSWATCDAIGHATGVYFPHRSHGARIAIKKLRYTMEIAHETGIVDGEAQIRVLKKAQDVLGNLHDRQELIDELCDSGAAAPPPTGVGEHIAVIRQVIEAECRDLHDRYLKRRDRVLAVCEEGSRLAPPRRAAMRSLVTAGAVALSTGLYLAHRQRLALRHGD